MLGRRCHYPLASQAPRQVPAARRLEVRSPCHWVSAVYVKVPPFVSRCCEISTTWSMKISEVVDVTLRMSCSTSRELTSLEAQVSLFQWPGDHFFHVASMASEQVFYNSFTEWLPYPITGCHSDIFMRSCVTPP